MQRTRLLAGLARAAGSDHEVLLAIDHVGAGRSGADKRSDLNCSTAHWRASVVRVVSISAVGS